jgi:hypothetical protein
LHSVLRKRTELILARYGDDPGASIVYGRALWLFRKEGAAGEAANKAFDGALRQNPFVTPYFLGESPYPRRLPDYYSFGDKNEANRMRTRRNRELGRHTLRAGLAEGARCNKCGGPQENQAAAGPQVRG